MYALKQFQHYQPWTTIYNPHSSCFTTMAVCLENGGFTCKVGIHLAIQEYEFDIKYKRSRGKENGKADALSRNTYPDTQMVAATSQTPVFKEILCQQQVTDPVIRQLTQPSLIAMLNLLLQKALSGVNLPFLDIHSCGHSFFLVMKLCVTSMLQPQVYSL